VSLILLTNDIISLSEWLAEVATALAVTGVGASVGLAAYFYYRSEVERQRREAATSGPAAPLNDVQDASVAIVKELSTSTSSPGSSNVAAAPTGYLTCELIRREMCSNDVGVFEFQVGLSQSPPYLFFVHSHNLLSSCPTPDLLYSCPNHFRCLQTIFHFSNKYLSLNCFLYFFLSICHQLTDT
tara:strand:+ start:2529 stop:3080 length:552 start_codon:yes stop_codon:yes gene_type:complete